ncbi:MAG: hypothetical protein DRN92_01100 [Thermoproteota archaeon]|nr:MAG: hypothetical protein DRN92_01100 [Candidatus Korarchaeota archaeon]
MIDEERIENRYRGRAVEILFTITTIAYWVPIFVLNFWSFLLKPTNFEQTLEWFVTFLPKWVIITFVSVAAGELIGMLLGRRKVRELLRNARQLEMRSLREYSDVRMSVSKVGEYIFLKIAPRISGTIEEEIEDIERSINAVKEDYGIVDRDFMSATVYVSKKEYVEKATEWARSLFGSKRLKVLLKPPEKGDISVDIVAYSPEKKR